MEVMASDQVRTPAAEQEFDIILQPVSHPGLGEIRIEENLFAIGREEAPFAAYAPELVADLSRRHARIFAERGSIFVADLGSKNGTTVNGASVRQKMVRLQQGDELCFAGVLCYRVQARPQPRRSATAVRIARLILTPEHAEAGLQPVVIEQFPFLVSKADDVFARYKASHPHQVNYLSRRHAHIFLKGGQAWIEDLGSTNGSFVAGKRLDEHAVQLHEGDMLAFGGRHFVYRVSLEQEPESADQTVTRLSPSSGKGAPVADADKTTFVAAANSFLDIFCIDQAQQQDEAVNAEAGQSPEPQPAATSKAHGKFASLAAELGIAFFRGEEGEVGGLGGLGKVDAMRRTVRWAAVAAAVIVLFAGGIYLRGWPQRNVQNLLADGRYQQAASAASRYLEGDPDDSRMRALASDALLKAYVPPWWEQIRGRRFDQAAATIATMKKLAARNPDVQLLIAELEWLGDTEKFVAARGGPDVPVQSPADEAAIKRILARWDDGRERHQSAFATISLAVPEFRDIYAQTLSHLRKLALTGSQKGEASNEQRKPPPAPDAGAGRP